MYTHLDLNKQKLLFAVVQGRAAAESQHLLRGESNKNAYLLTNTWENSMFTYTHAAPSTSVTLIKQRQPCASPFALMQPLYFLSNNKESPHPLPRAVGSVSDNARPRCSLKCLSLSNALIILAAPLLKSPWTESDMERIEFRQGRG